MFWCCISFIVCPWGRKSGKVEHLRIADLSTLLLLPLTLKLLGINRFSKVLFNLTTSSSGSGTCRRTVHVCLNVTRRVASQSALQVYNRPLSTPFSTKNHPPFRNCDTGRNVNFNDFTWSNLSQNKFKQYHARLEKPFRQEKKSGIPSLDICMSSKLCRWWCENTYKCYVEYKT